MSTSSTAHVRGALIDRETAAPDVLPAQDALALLQGLLAGWFGNGPIKIYEAGGGSISYLPPALTEKADITVVDIDEDQVRNNTYATTKIRGDIQTHDFTGQNFDLVVCNYVIEHIERPDKALINFANALAPNGLVVIAAPNPHSFTGAITKYTPHWFHVWFYRTVLGNKSAGRPGTAPFRTIYHPLVSPYALLEFSRRHGYRVVYFKVFESVQLGNLRQRRPALARLLHAFIRTLEIVSRSSLRLGDFHLVLEKVPAEA
jgi:SAM-dependent methyltransferase